MKKTFKSIAAVAAAAVMSVQALAVTASAGDYYYYYNGVYYSREKDATYEAQSTVLWEAVLKKYVKGTQKWYSYDAHKIYSTEAEAKQQGTDYADIYVTTDYSYGYGRWYSSYTNKYYDSYEAALAASKGISAYVSYGYYDYYDYYGYYNGYYYGNPYRYTDSYYSMVTKKYYSSYSQALAASNHDASKVIKVNGYYGYDYYGYENPYGYGYYSTYTGKYYSTYEAALAASKGVASYVVKVNGSAYYTGAINRYIFKGAYYASLADAIKAGGTALGVDIFYAENADPVNTTYYYYFNGKYYGSLAAAKKAGGTALGEDIFYVPKGYYGNYYLSSMYGTIINPEKTTMDSTTPAKSYTAPDGTPYVYGKSTKYGWDTIVNYIKASSKGEKVKVDMNGSIEVDSSALKALKGKNIDLVCVLDNGAVWTINGRDIDDTSKMNIFTGYNINYIPSNLVKKASKGAISCTQVGISEDNIDLCGDVNITVKFPTKRKGLTATIYVYNEKKGTLKGVAKSKVLSDGTCTFETYQGGAYLIVLD